MEIFKKLESLGFFNWLDKEHNLRDTDMNPEYLDNLSLIDIHRTVANYMAFRWFREKYQLHSTITSISQESWQWHIQKPGQQLGKLYDEDFYTHEEAELECLKELIEIVKSQKTK